MKHWADQFLFQFKEKNPLIYINKSWYISLQTSKFNLNFKQQYEWPTQITTSSSNLPYM